MMGEMLTNGFQLIPIPLPVRLEQKIALVGQDQRPIAMCLVFMRVVLQNTERRLT